MKILLALFVVAIINTNAFAQTPDKVLARVRYTYINKKDTLKTSKTRSENMLLFIGKNASLYTSYDRLNYQIAVDQKVRAIGMGLIDDGKPKSIAIDLSASEWMSSSTILCFISEKKYYFKEIIKDEGYLIEEKMPTQNWTLTKDTLNFSGIPCQKATSTYGGRNWIAYFAPSLPFQSGPWELNGLPGLIIEAYDENREIQFQFAGIENAKEDDFKRISDVTKRVNSSPDLINTIDLMLGFDVANAYFANSIQLPNFAIKTTKQKLDAFRKAIEKDKKILLKN